jgi:hypothetical protein
MSTALLTVERGFMRVGLGVTSVETRWKELAFSAQYVQAPPVYFGSTTPTLVRTEIMVPSTERTTAVGPAGLIALAIPVSDLGFFEARLHGYHGLHASIDGLLGYPSWTAHFDGTSFSVGVGVYF